MAMPEAVLSKGLRISEFARHLGVDPKEIRQAIGNGRLERSLGRTPGGQAVIVDVALAEQEWVENKQRERARKGSVPLGTIAEARNRVLRAQAKKLELGNKERIAQLVPAKRLQMWFTTQVIGARTKLLGLPSRMKQRIPHLTAADLVVVNELIREALEGLAEGTI